MYDKQQFLAAVKEKAGQKQVAAQAAYRVIAAAGQVMGHLTTGSDDWNRFLGYLQGKRNQVEALKAEAQRKQNDPTIWDPAALNKLKADILQADARLETLDWVMLIPKALVDGGSEATEFLNKLEPKDDKGTNTEPA